MYPCQFPGCPTNKPFERPDDLERHYRNVHASVEYLTQRPSTGLKRAPNPVLFQASSSSAGAGGEPLIDFLVEPEDSFSTQSMDSPEQPLSKAAAQNNLAQFSLSPQEALPYCVVEV